MSCLNLREISVMNAGMLKYSTLTLYQTLLQNEQVMMSICFNLLNKNLLIYKILACKIFYVAKMRLAS